MKEIINSVKNLPIATLIVLIALFVIMVLLLVTLIIVNTKYKKLKKVKVVLDGNLSRKDTDYNTTSADLEHYKQKVQEINEKYESVKASNNQLLDMVSVREEEINNLNNKLTADITSIEELNATVKTLTDSVDELAADKTKLTQENTLLKNRKYSTLNKLEHLEIKKEYLSENELLKNNIIRLKDEYTETTKAILNTVESIINRVDFRTSDSIETNCVIKDGEIESLSRAELLEIAKRFNIPNAAHSKNEELVEAIKNLL